MWYYTLSMFVARLLSQDFLLTNLWWIILVAIVFVAALSFLLARLFKKKGPSPKKSLPKADPEGCLLSLGGPENVIEHNLTGSRIVLRLKDYKVVDKESLLRLGVDGFIEKSDKLTLVIK